MSLRLYTNLVRVKQALDVGYEPPMTPIPKNLYHLINPKFTIGMGALYEDPELGLRCPVRGCGKYYHQLSKHLYHKHDDVGGSDAIRAALSIPRSVGLVSRSYLDMLRKRSRDNPQLLKNLGKNIKRHNKNQKNRPKFVTTIHARNTRNACEAQIYHRMWDIHNKLGRSPSFKEMELLGEENLYHECTRVYGSWNAAKTHLGMEIKPWGKAHFNKEKVVVAIGEWYKAHGKLPKRGDIAKPTRFPLTPSPSTILLVFNTTYWSVAMCKIAVTLGIYDKRYRPEPA